MVYADPVVSLGVEELGRRRQSLLVPGQARVELDYGEEAQLTVERNSEGHNGLELGRIRELMLEHFFLQLHLIVKVVDDYLALVVLLEANHHVIQVGVLASIQLAEGNHLPEALLEDQFFADAVEGSLEFEQPDLSIEERD